MADVEILLPTAETITREMTDLANREHPSQLQDDE